MDLNSIEKRIKHSRLFVMACFLLTIGIYIAWFSIYNKQPPSTSTGDWGTFGDFVGGLLNPVVAFSAFYWLTISVQVQKNELQETRNALISTSQAQQDQVKIATINAQVDTVKMRIQQVNTTLTAELAHWNTLIDISTRVQDILDKNGEIVKVKDLITTSRIKINQLDRNQSSLIGEAERLVERLEKASR